MARLLRADKISVRQCVEALLKGKAIIYPTETVYGLGVDAMNENAVEGLFEIKEREKSRPVSVAVADIEHAKKLAVFNKFSDALAEKFLPGPLTLVLKARITMPLITTNGRIGIRVPSNRFAQVLLQQFSKPITATSANISGLKSAVDIREIDRRLLDNVELIVEDPEIRYKKESTVIDLSSSKPRI
ncbi:MAG: L-threonylcarbamoyladenylate synthase, partial [Candidatus Micrarchaeales archaeon]